MISRLKTAVICCALVTQMFNLAKEAIAANTLAEAYRAEAARLYEQGYLEKADLMYSKSYAETEPRGNDRITLEQATILSEWGQVESKLAEEYEQKAEQ